MKNHWILFFIFGILLYYFLRCFISHLKIKENLINYCNPIFTADGTEVTISPLMYNSKYLSIDMNSIRDNIILNSIPTTWLFEKNITEKSLDDSTNDTRELFISNGYSNENTRPDRCSVYIKTKSPFKTNDKKIPDYLDYYVTINKKENSINEVGNNYISASLFGRSKTQIWYVIDISELPTKTDILEEKRLIDIVNKTKNIVDTSSKNTRYVYIINNQNNILTFLTYNSIYNNLGAATISKIPTINSIWKIDIIKTGNIKCEDAYKPTLSIGDFPNNDNKQSGSFMAFFLPLWNRKWYTTKNGEIQEFTVNLCTSNSFTNDIYSVKDTYATGSITLNDNTIYNVRTYGSDMVYGKNNNNNSNIILKMIPQNKKHDNTLPGGIPMIYGWIDDSNGDVKSICASNEKNLAGVCLSPPSDNDDYQKYLIKLDLLPINPKINYNLSENFTSNNISQYLGNLTKYVK